MNAARGESDQDRIAVQAAMLLSAGAVSHISQAIRSAAEALGLSAGQMPSAASVRKHAQALALQAMGDQQYVQSRLAILRIAEELMTALEQRGVESLLIGRAAAGHLDGDVKLHLRLLADAPVSELAQDLVDFGYDEPRIETVETMYGRLNRMLLQEDGIPIVLMRCPPSLNIDSRQDAFTGKSIVSMTLAQLRRRINDGQES